ncbi:MAG: AAA family ATPase [Magnetococcales bacterium]|nr:AAA family ATPase [Magnetococcales bacterium]
MTQKPQGNPQSDAAASAAGNATFSELAAMASQREAYLDFLGLQKNPFPVAPDVDSFYLPSRIDSLIAETLHCIQTRKGFMILTGEVGLGKTTISQRLLRIMEGQQIETALVLNTYLQGLDLLAEINRDFGIEVDDAVPQRHLSVLNDFLMDRYHKGINCALVVDDAQNLTKDSLELIRMISNLETNAEKLVQILLVGQPELEEKLNSHELRQLKSRVVVHGRVQPLSLDDLKQYAFFKINAAGGHGGITIPDRAFRLIHELTDGNPRLINKLMDRALYGLFAYNTSKMSRALIQEISEEVGLSPPAEVGGERTPSKLMGVVLWLIGGAILAGAAYVSGPYLLSFLEKHGVLHTPTAHEETISSKPVSLPMTDAVSIENLRAQAEAEFARAKRAKEQAKSETISARVAQEKAKAEVARAKTEEEKARAEMARIKADALRVQALRAEALAKLNAQEEHLERAREAQAAAEEAASLAKRQAAKALLLASQSSQETRSEARAEARKAALEAQKREEVLQGARKARDNAEMFLAKRQAVLERLQQTAQKQSQALAEAHMARDKALSEASTAREEAERVKQAASKAMEEAERIRRRAEQQLSRVQAEAEARALEKESAVREEAEAELKRMQASSAKALKEAEQARKRAEREMMRVRDEMRRVRNAAVRGEGSGAEADLNPAVVGSNYPGLRPFLEAYGLEEHHDTFARALDDGWIDEIAQRIVRQEGLSLVRLRPGEEPQNREHLFRVDTGIEEETLIFWKSPITLDRFYYGMQSDEVTKLQKLLAKLGYYRFPLDGNVGRNTMRSLTAFQKGIGMTETGYPDVTTLYRLVHAAKGRKTTTVGSAPQKRKRVKPVPVQEKQKRTPRRPSTLSVQVASFDRESLAVALRDRLVRDGFPAVIKPVRSSASRSTWWVVRSGAFQDMEDAEVLKSVLERKYAVKGLITNY